MTQRTAQPPPVLLQGHLIQERASWWAYSASSQAGWYLRYPLKRGWARQRRPLRVSPAQLQG